MTTVTISLPKSIYDDAKKLVKTRPFKSVNDVVQQALTRFIKEEDPNTITENGFPVWFEDEVLKSAAEPMENDKTWETEEDTDRYFDELHKKLEKKRHGKG
jgi:Arc/MetJ-type ribon-helix-helix transcriptional regulator